MKLHGSTEGNLISAVRSASRLRDRPVHADTVKFWSDLVVHAKNEKFICVAAQATGLEHLIAELELAIAQRRSARKIPLDRN